MMAYQEPYALFSTDGFGLDNISASDGQLPHPRSTGATARFLGEFIREKAALSWEDAIHKMTLGPAEHLGLKDRGVLIEGASADIVLVNPETIKDSADYTNPYREPEGIPWVIVNGDIALENSAPTGRKKGKILRK